MTRILLALGTHWDREWYQPFQGFRYRLVETLDEVIQNLEHDPEISVFHFDGQTAMLEDYLEIRPENEARLRTLIQAGRIMLGPWYTMPDGFLVGAESYLRNLERGLATARKYACDFKEGYVSDIFGFNSQIPQLFQLCGIRSAYVFRGTTDKDHPRQFKWESPDGSAVFCHRFMEDYGYCEFYSVVRSAERSLGRQLDINGAAERALAMLKNNCASQGRATCLISDAADHADLEPHITALVSKINEKLDWGKVEIGSLAEFTTTCLAEGALPSVQGELRAPAVRFNTPNWITQHVLSSYASLKLWNRSVESLLTRWAEPFDAIATSQDNPPTDASGFMARAWKWLLQNHAHDSICGCSVDTVHQDMEFRFRQAELIGHEILERGLKTLLHQVKPNFFVTNEITVQVYNPLPVPVSTVIDITLKLPSPEYKLHETDVTQRIAVKGYPHNLDGFFGESYPLLKVNDAVGNELPFAIAEVIDKITHREQIQGAFPKVIETEGIKVTVPVGVPALGTTILKFSPATTPARQLNGLFKAPNILENSKIKISIAANGAIELHDKKTAQTYANLFLFEDGADFGDGWFYHPPAADRIIYSGRPTAIEVVENSSLKSVVDVKYSLDVPAHIDRRTRKRSDQTKRLEITVSLTLKQDSRMVESVISVANVIADHRLRVLFRPGIQSSFTTTSTACDLVERQVGLNPGDASAKEYINTFPTDGLVFSRNTEHNGLALLCPGIYESCVSDPDDQLLSLTLLRCFHKTIMTDGESNGQLAGIHQFKVALLPIDHGDNAAALLCALDQFELGVKYRQKDGCNGEELQPRSYLKVVSGDFRMMALRKRDDHHWELRGYNPASHPTVLKLEVNLPFTTAEFVNLRGERMGDLTVIANEITASLRPKQILNILFTGK